MEDFTDIFYKYADEKGARAILTNQTLRFSSPSEMNDPFDAYIEDLYGFSTQEIFEDCFEDFFDEMKARPEFFSQILEVDLDTTLKSANILKGLSKDKLLLMKQNLRRILDKHPQHQNQSKKVQETHNRFVEMFKTYGIFCATRTNNNLLMWAHYTDKHRGAVLGFKPDIEKDSYLKLLKPVSYSDERPSIISRGLEWLENDTSSEEAENVNFKLLHSKSTQWSYEEELRIATPYEILDDKKEKFLKFNPSELIEIYFGCRASERAKAELLSLAKSINPCVNAYSAHLVKRKYDLEFQKIT